MNESDHGRVVRIFVCLSRGLYCHRKSKRVLEQGWPTARQKRSYLYHQGEFQHNYFDFVSLHHSDHDGVVRISVRHSEIVKRFNDYIILYYAAQFFLYQECNDGTFSESISTFCACLNSATNQPLANVKPIAMLQELLEIYVCTHTQTQYS